MSDEFESEDFDELERQLREAHALTPRAGLQEEIRARLRPRWMVPWAGFSAAAAVLLAVVGVGLLLHSVPRGGGGGGDAASGASFGARSASGGAVASFGLLPPPDIHQTSGAAAAEPSLKTQDGIATSAGAPAPVAILPATALVYRYRVPGPSCSQDPNLRLGGDPVVGGAPCWAYDAAVPYGLRAAPSGATLAYVGVPDGSVTYYEPVYVLPSGVIESALTPDELRS